MKKYIGLLFSLAAFTPLSPAQFDGEYYRISCQWLGTNKTLAVETKNNTHYPILTDKSDNPNQYWRLQSVGNNYYRLTNKALGPNLALDVINDGKNTQLHLSPSGNFSGQYWKLSPANQNYYRLSTQWRGENMPLDVINDGSNNKVHLSPNGNFSGQYWRFSPLQNQPLPPLNPTQNIAGFTVHLSPNALASPNTPKALDLLNSKLQALALILQPHTYQQLQKTHFWLEYKKNPDGAMCFHPSAAWLTANGYTPLMEKSIEITNIDHFLDWQQSSQPFMVLHELAHAYHDMHRHTLDNRINAAYQQALQSRKYEQVKHIQGGTHRHYALNNPAEYFAELTETYLGSNDYFPFNKKDLQTFDPVGYQLMQEVWD